MRCPFLVESTAWFCELQPTRLLPRCEESTSGPSPCFGGPSPACPFVQRGEIATVEHDDRGTCNRLRQRRVLACDAAPRRNYFPYVQGLLSRCQSDSFRFCPLYLGRETPQARLRGHSVEVDDLIVATDRSYTPNHLWIVEGELGTYTLGIDDLIRFVLPRLDAVHFVTHAGIDRPRVLLVGGTAQLDLELPFRMEILSTNVHARREPAAVFHDPYGAGWLVEARGLEAKHHDKGIEGLIPGEAAPAWMARERRRLDHFAHTHAHVPTDELGVTANDGGRCAPGLAGRLDALGRARLHRAFLHWNHEEVDS